MVVRLVLNFSCLLEYICFMWIKVLAEEGKAKAIAFDEIDKAPEEKKRGITIATVGSYLPLCILIFH